MLVEIGRADLRTATKFRFGDEGIPVGIDENSVR